MITLYILIFAISILYFSISVNIRSYINLLGVQGVLLFLIALSGLNEFHILQLSFVAVETLVFKGIIVPRFLLNVAKKNRVTNIKNFKLRRKMKGFYLILTTVLVYLITLLLGYTLKNDFLNVKFFSTGITAIIMGLIFIIINKNITVHIISFIVIENGVFLMALAIGNKMPMLVNTAVLLDLFVSVLVLGVFFNKLTYQFHDDSSDKLSTLKE